MGLCLLVVVGLLHFKWLGRTDDRCGAPTDGAVAPDARRTHLAASAYARARMRTQLGVMVPPSLPGAAASRRFHVSNGSYSPLLFILLYVNAYCTVNDKGIGFLIWMTFIKDEELEIRHGKGL